jgi:uncharacterized protein YbjQ (UPF0145 family)
MSEKAKKSGVNLIVRLRFSTAGVTAHATEILVCGVAVVVE